MTTGVAAMPAREPPPPSLFEGGGEMGALMRAHDWSRTPLGAPSGWPAALRAAVRMLLAARAPMAIGWGRELTWLYNDACRPLLGGKHPAALGRPAREVIDPPAAWSQSALPDDEGGAGGVIYTPEARALDDDRGWAQAVIDLERAGSAGFSASPATNGARVLLAEDDPALRAYVRRQLGVHYQVEAVADGEAALAAARHDPPDLVLADVMMPRLDGFALLRALRADDVTAAIPVILISARAGEESRVAGMGAGADDYLVKPFRARELLARVDAHLRLSRLRREAEQALQSSEQRFRATFEQAAVGIAICASDGRFLEVNPGLCDTLGYSAEELRALSFADLTLPEDREEERRLAARVLAGEIDTYTVEQRCRRRTGEIVWVEISASVVRDRAGQALYTVSIVQEFTQRKLAEEALRRSEERYRLAAQATSDAIWDWDLFTDEIKWSQAMADRFGWTEAPDGTSLSWWEERVHPEDLARVDASLCAVSRGETGDADAWQEEYRFRRADGSYAFVFDRGALVRDPAGRPVRMVGAILDLTERKRVEEERAAILDSERAARAEAERANKLKDDFLAVMSHELRTPLNAILGWTQMLRRGTLPPATVQKALEVIERNTLVQSQLIADLLDVSRITSGKLKLETGRADLGATVDAAMDAVRQAAAAKGVQLHRTNECGAACVIGDPARLQQVVWNLLSNAVKFSPAGGHVRVSLACREGRAVIRVRDEGQGIRPEFLPHLFERFSQADSSAARQHGGLGLGLSIVKHLVDLHGGSVRAESEGEGRGATFIVELPLADALADSGRPSGGALAPGALLGDLPQLSGLRVVVVDDEPDARELVGRVLAEAGADVRTAGSAAEALEQIQRDRPDVVVSDLGMPGEDGFHLIRVIRGMQGDPLPAVAVTAFARAEDRARALAAGFDAHVAKPLDLRELLAVLIQVAGRPERR